jgi:Lon protease-like protein
MRTNVQDASEFLPQTFSGRIPIFPLPNVALFPYAMLPLHIFEPRYRQMTADVLAGEQLIGMVKLKAGWEGSLAPQDPAPDVHGVFGVGQITTHHQLPDGRYHIVLRGIGRARIVEELSTNLPYRVARVESLPDTPPIWSREQERDLISLLLADASLRNSQESFQKLVSDLKDRDLSLSVLTDILAGILSLPPAFAQTLLEERSPSTRGVQLLGWLRHTNPRPDRNFPPQFSNN